MRVLVAILKALFTVVAVVALTIGVMLLVVYLEWVGASIVVGIVLIVLFCVSLAYNLEHG